MFVTAGIRRIAQDLTGIVDPDRIGDRETGLGRNECVEIDQAAIAHDESDVFAGFEGMIAGHGKNCDAYDLQRSVNAGRVDPGRPRYPAQIGLNAIAEEGRV